MATMASKRDYYEILSVKRTASDRDIAISYRKLAVKYHPDSNPGDAEAIEKFKEAAEAYEILSDAEKRARYDQYGHAGTDQFAHQFDNAEDIFEAFGDIFSEMFGGQRRGGGRRVRRGADVRVDVTLTLEEAAKGAVKSVDFPSSKACGTCKGTGSKPGSQRTPCRHCGGRGPNRSIRRHPPRANHLSRLPRRGFARHRPLHRLPRSRPGRRAVQARRDDSGRRR